jgi:general secretion pathway protein L
MMANLLGIEIGSDTVRGALVKTVLRKVQLARLVEVPILAASELAPPPAESAEGAAPLGAAEVLDPVQVAVRELLRQIGSPRPAILAALPGEDVSIRRLELPAAAAKKLDELLPFEMEALVPFDAEQTVLDHQPIETAEGKLRVLVVAAPKERVRAQLEHFVRLGADPDELAVGPAALDGLPQIIPGLATEGPHVVVHLGYRRTDVCILRRGRAELARTISAGMADVGGVDFATFGGTTAQLGAGAYGFPGSGSAAERLARELRQTISAWRLHGGAPPVAVHLSGVGLHDLRIVAWFGEVLGRHVEILAVPDTNPPAGQDPATRARFGMALALAARAIPRGKRFDLRKGEFASRRSTGLVRRHAKLFAACAGAVVCAFLFSSYARWSVLEARRRMLEDRLARVTRERLGEETRSPTRVRTLLESGGVRIDPLPRFTAYDALAAISNAIPTDIRHDTQRLQIDLADGRSGGRFEIAGIVGTIEDRDRIAQALGQVECFRDIQLGPLTQAPNDRRSYRIEGAIRCPNEGGGEGLPSKRRGGRSRPRTGQGVGP